jgi:hypothetical protein
MQWNKVYGGLYDDIAYSVQQTNDEGYIICGYTGTLVGYEDFWLVKTDSNGEEIWNKTYGGENSEYAYFVQQTNDNGYIIAGSAYSSGTEFDMWLVKTDSSGNMQWNKTYGGLLDEEAYSVRQTIEGGYIITGFTDSFAGNRDIWLIKTDSFGNIEWSQTYGGAANDEACAVQQTSDRGYIVAGTTYSFGPSWDPNFWLIKLAYAPGDLGSGPPPTFFAYDGNVDAWDYALWKACYDGTAPPNAIYLGDLGSGPPPTFFAYDGNVDAWDYALWKACYDGLGPDP